MWCTLALAGVMAGVLAVRPAISGGTNSKGEIEELLRTLPPAGAPPPAASPAPAPAAPIPPPSSPDAPAPATEPPPGRPDLGAAPLSPAAGMPQAAEPPLPPPEIVWRVENPFRFFTDPADTEVHRATWLALTEAERAAPILAAERALARRHADGWAETMFRKTCWNAGLNRHRCPDAASYINPSSHRIVAEVKNVAEAEEECTWLTAPKGGRSPRGKALRQPCREPAILDVPYPGGLGLTVEVGGSEVARTQIKVRDVLVAGIGDSFGSGEGNPDIPVRFSRERAADYGKAEKTPDLVGYPARVGSWSIIGDKDFIEGGAQWLDTACHRSLYAHQIRAGLQLAVEDPHRAVTLVDLACSGAEVTTGLFLRYKGNEWVPSPPELSQISALGEAQCGAREAPMQDLPEAFHIKGAIPELQGGVVLRRCDRRDARRIDLLMVSIGGNDIGFARLVANAVLADKGTLKRLGGWFGQVHGEAQSQALLDRLDERYKALNRAVHGILHVPWEESARVILAAYPPLAVLGDGNAICPDGTAGMEVYSEFALSQARARESSALADKLQKVMAASAKTHGWSFADAHRSAFNGRGICAGFTDNAFSMADDLRLPRRVNGAWQPYNPADYKAYEVRERWFRTPNDAFMTANFHVSGSVFQKVLKLQSLSWFQVMLASTYGGAFHPTAEGHAAIADAVAEKGRAVLKKYGQ
jgi:hypothetical protein